jgi:hypothetical protein
MTTPEMIDVLNVVCADLLPKDKIDFCIDRQQPLTLTGNFYLVGSISFSTEEIKQHSKNGIKEFLNFIKRRIYKSQLEVAQELLTMMQKVV